VGASKEVWRDDKRPEISHGCFEVAAVDEIDWDELKRRGDELIRLLLEKERDERE